MNNAQLQSIENWWNKKGSFNMAHFERVLAAKEKYETNPDNCYMDVLKKRITRPKQKPRYIIQYGRGGRGTTTYVPILLIALLLSSCRTLDTYHCQEKPDGTMRTIKDDGSNELNAFWIKAHYPKRLNWFLMQKEKVYLPAGTNCIIKDTFYTHKNRYHILTTVNNGDTLITYFLLK